MIAELRRILRISAAFGLAFVGILSLLGRLNAANVGGMLTGISVSAINICLLARSLRRIADGGISDARRSIRIGYAMRMLLMLSLSLVAIAGLHVDPLIHAAFMPITGVAARLRRR